MTSLHIEFRPVAEGPIAIDQIEAFNRFRALFDIRGRRVLEIGGCLPRHLTSEAKVWWSVDPRNEMYERCDHVVQLRDRVESLPSEVRDVDLVFACNSFQHISDMAGCYEALKAALRPGGYIYANFGPIWSAPDGAHFENVQFLGKRYDFWDGALIPSWSHLLLEGDDFRRLAVELNGRDVGSALADYVERSDWINRITLKQHSELMRTAGFDVQSVRGARAFGYRYAPPPVPEAYSEKFTAAEVRRVAQDRFGLSPDDLQIRDLELVLTRP